MRLGVLDIGSNTVHLLVVDAYQGAAPVAAHSRKIELRLAEHLDSDGNIDRVAITSLENFLREAQAAAEDLGVTEIMAFATSAVREAPNGEDVLAEVRNSTDVDITVLTGAEEARLTFLAVRRWFGWSSGRLLVLDIGGGSLEIAIGADEEPDEAISIPLGAGRLTRDWLSQDPPRRGEGARIASSCAGRDSGGSCPHSALGNSPASRRDLEDFPPTCPDSRCRAILGGPTSPSSAGIDRFD